ncbi:unnamed protein product [Moneuplotes crassus]|uniref:Uncharacterized protein n=1 Tax=Euplotes crassus TaxID=5936 RepID=A0AAD1XR79_EUPCR|nr:unnamed protein product [Moneuplotes crassus]
MAIVGKYGQRRFITLKKLWYNHMKRVYPDTVVAKFKLQRVHYVLIFFSGMIGFQNLFAGSLTMRARFKTFRKNRALVESRYGETHRKNFGPDSKISSLGYPDMGNNIYADCLPYNDWIHMNNVIRMHESMIDKTATVLSCTFLTALSFPKTAAFLLSWYCLSQFWYMNHYYKRGISRAVGSEEGLKILAFLMTIGAGMSTLRLLGLFRFIGRFSPVPKIRAWRARRAALKAKK